MNLTTIQLINEQGNIYNQPALIIKSKKVIGGVIDTLLISNPRNDGSSERYTIDIISK